MPGSNPLPFIGWVTNLELGLAIVFFIFAAVLVVFSAIAAPRLLTRIFKQTRITSNFIAVIFVAVLTSTPELISIIFSPTVAETKGVVWAFSNVFGANLLAAVFLMFFQLVFFLRIRHHPDLKSILLTLPFIILFNVLYFVFLIFPEQILSLKIGNQFFNLFSLLLIGIYILMTVFLFYQHKPQTTLSAHVPKAQPLPRPKMFGLICLTIVSAVTLIGSMFVLLGLAEPIENSVCLPPLFTGGVLVALVTIFPEVISALSYFLIGKFANGVGVFIGSQLFNMVLLTLLIGLEGNVVSTGDFTEYKSGVLKLLATTLTVNVLLFFNYLLLVHTKQKFAWLVPIIIFAIFLGFWIFILIEA